MPLSTCAVVAAACGMYSAKRSSITSTVSSLPASAPLRLTGARVSGP
jgi:hypothetical protein